MVTSNCSCDTVKAAVNQVNLSGHKYLEDEEAMQSTFCASLCESCWGEDDELRRAQTFLVRVISIFALFWGERCSSRGKAELLFEKVISVKVFILVSTNTLPSQLSHSGTRTLFNRP